MEWLQNKCALLVSIIWRVRVDSPLRGSFLSARVSGSSLRREVALTNLICDGFHAVRSPKCYGYEYVIYTHTWTYDSWPSFHIPSRSRISTKLRSQNYVGDYHWSSITDHDGMIQVNSIVTALTVYDPSPNFVARFDLLRCGSKESEVYAYVSRHLRFRLSRNFVQDLRLVSCVPE